MSRFQLPEKKAVVHKRVVAVLFWVNEINKPLFMVAQGAVGHLHRQTWPGLFRWMFMCAMFFLWLIDWWVDWRNQQVAEVGKYLESLTIMKDHIPASRIKLDELLQEVSKQIKPATEGKPGDTNEVDTTKLAIVANLEHDFASRHFLVLIVGILSTFIIKSRKRTLQLINSVLWFAVGVYLLFA